MTIIDDLEKELSLRAANLRGEAESQEAQLAALEAERIARLETMKQRAEADKVEADRIEAKAGSDSTAWLSAEELAHATARQPFVLEDLKNASPDDLVNRINQAIEAHDRPLLWLLHRLAPARWAEYPPEELGGIRLAREYSRATGELALAIVPEPVLGAQARAHELRVGAEERRVEAAHALWVANGKKGSFNPFR